MKRNIALLAIVAILFLGANACSKSNAESDKKDEQIVSYSLEPLVVNVQGSDDVRYVKMSLAFELAGAALAERAKIKTPQLRDAIIAVVTTKSTDELSTAEGKEQLKQEILARANEILDKGVRNIYFTEFVLQ